MAKHQAPKTCVVRHFFSSHFGFWLLCTQTNCTCLWCRRASYGLWTESRWMLLYFFTFICLSKQNYDGNGERQKWRQPQQPQQQLLNLRKSLVCQWVYASLFFAVVSHTYLLFVCIYYFRSISVKWLLLYVCLYFLVFFYAFFFIPFSSLLQWTLSLMLPSLFLALVHSKGFFLLNFFIFFCVVAQHKQQTRLFAVYMRFFRCALCHSFIRFD